MAVEGGTLEEKNNRSWSDFVLFDRLAWSLPIKSS